MSPTFPAPLSGAKQDETDVFRPRFDAAGLVSAIVVDARSGEVLMLAHMNSDALEKTLSTGIAHYWSRSRGQLWMKGETSGNTQEVVAIDTDCDQDAIILHVRMQGDARACHTNRRSCFYRRIMPSSDGWRLVSKD